ncbi:extracellular matrix protein 2-like [Halictus rubicundus]|uniref:extracellular matrix protein 2-like n=1 Tax=Halictus rubicundus TaxID=77578 RepID=UPI004036AF22
MMWACGFVLVLLLPQYRSIREIDFRGTVDIDIENDLFPRPPVKHCGEEDAVNLTESGFSKLPIHMIKSDKIRNVDLSFNSISNIPNSFFRDVPAIECLNLMGNRYSPRDVLDGSTSDSLKTLILDRARFDSWRERPCEMKGYFPNLETLHLNKIERCFIDASLETHLPRLATLFLMDYGSNTGAYNWRLPSTLRELHLEGTRFSEFSVDTFSNLQSLYLDRYSYVDGLNIPTTATNLQVVSCRYCSLDSSALFQFLKSPRDALRLLDLSHNNLSYLRDNIFQHAKNLEGLLLSNNNISNIPDVQTMPRLRGLVLSHNEINQIADMKCDSLEMLSLRDNNITVIDNTTFLGLPALQVLDLSENKLATLPIGWARSLKNLVILNLDSNLFARLSDTSLTAATTGLRHLSMKGNPIERIVDEDLKLVPDNCTIYLLLSNKTSVQDKTFKIRIVSPSTQRIYYDDDY